jgi:hypothetical protein
LPDRQGAFTGQRTGNCARVMTPKLIKFRGRKPDHNLVSHSDHLEKRYACFVLRGNRVTNNEGEIPFD